MDRGGPTRNGPCALPGWIEGEIPACCMIHLNVSTTNGILTPVFLEKKGGSPFLPSFNTVYFRMKRSLRALTNTPECTIKDHFSQLGVITDVRFVVLAASPLLYSRLHLSEVIKRRFRHLNEILGEKVSFGINPDARIGHDVSLEIYATNRITMIMPPHAYHKFGISGKKREECYIVEIQRQSEGEAKLWNRALECAKAWDQGPFNGPFLGMETFFLGTGHPILYTSRQSYIDASFLDDLLTNNQILEQNNSSSSIFEPVSFIESMGESLLRRDGSDLLHTYDGIVVSSAELAGLFDLEHPFVLLCRHIQSEATHILVHRPGELMWTLILENEISSVN